MKRYTGGKVKEERRITQNGHPSSAQRKDASSRGLKKKSSGTRPWTIRYKKKTLDKRPLREEQKKS